MRHSARDTNGSVEITHGEHAGGEREVKPIIWDMSIYERIVDAFCDTRLPHALPRSLWRMWKYKNIAVQHALPQTLHVCLTFDVEGNFREPGCTGATERFLPKYHRWAAERDIRSTLYVQGDLLPKLSKQFHPFLENHELGLHGLHHEVWGRSRWWQYSLGYRSISAEEKEVRLVEALDRFKKAGLPRPVTFRAPYLNTNRATLDLIDRYGFTSDSSVSTYYGTLAKPTKYRTMWEIPLTVHPKPIINRQNAHSSYMELSMGALVNTTIEQLWGVVQAALHVQQHANWILPPFLVILGHPWEFERTPRVSHSGEQNFDKLSLQLEFLAQRFPIKYTTMSDLILGRNA